MPQLTNACPCEDQRHTIARVGDRIAMRCTACGTVRDIGPAAHCDLDGGQGRTADDLAERAAIAGAAAILVILLGVGLACVISGRALL